jgi:hypothetical protein
LERIEVASPRPASAADYWFAGRRANQLREYPSDEALHESFLRALKN